MKKKIYYLMAGVMIASLSLVVSCDDDDEELPKIDGYNNSNEVAKDNLVAHWTFDDTKKEVISNTEPGSEFGAATSYTTGVIGKALQLNKSAIVYPSIAAIGAENSLSNYTVSMWLNVKNTKTDAGGPFSTFFGIFPTANTDFWGNLSMSAETGWFPASGPVGDTLVLKTNYMSKNGDGTTNGQDNRPDPKGNPPVGVFKAAATWAHFVARFDATTHKLQIFGNGTSIGAYDFRGDNTTALVMRTPAQAVIGSLSTSEIGFTGAPTRPDWQTLADAQVDDIRVFNTALSDAEINALKNLGDAGR